VSWSSSLAQIVGYEGLFGVIFTLGLMAPAAYYLPGVEGEGIHEDGLDTLEVRTCDTCTFMHTVVMQ
jgi:hypothetical protein